MLGVMMTSRTGAWIWSVLVFVVCLPLASFVGITLVGHARPLTARRRRAKQLHHAESVVIKGHSYRMRDQTNT